LWFAIDKQPWLQWSFLRGKARERQDFYWQMILQMAQDGL